MDKKIIDRVTNDVYKVLSRNGLVSRQDIEDIRQEITYWYLKLEQKHDGTPPTAAYLFSVARWRCMALFTPTTRNSNDVRVYSYSEEMMDEVYRPPVTGPDELFEEKERKECADVLRKQIIKLGVNLDDPLGPEFALWWIGMSYMEISIAYRAAELKSTNPYVIGRRIRRAFDEIGVKTGMTPKQIRTLRNSNTNH